MEHFLVRLLDTGVIIETTGAYDPRHEPEQIFGVNGEHENEMAALKVSLIAPRAELRSDCKIPFYFQMPALKFDVSSRHSSASGPLVAVTTLLPLLNNLNALEKLYV